MVWTDERTETLTSMWLSGATAGEIAKALGGVSRNAVLGKADRLGIFKTVNMRPNMLASIDELELSFRSSNALRENKIEYIGDLVQYSEEDLLAMANFGKKSLAEVCAVLSSMGLKLGVTVKGWPPENIKDLAGKINAARRASNLQQAPGGATFEPIDDRFSMVAIGNDTDLAASSRPIIEQMQTALLEKARNFETIAVRLGNQIGWNGIERAAKRLAELLDRKPEQIPDVLGLLYPVALELGSFIELDQQLLDGELSYALPMDPEVRRPLSDLVRTLAPWLRNFPSIRAVDDEASQFLVKASELKPASEVVEVAGKYLLLANHDVDVFHELFDAAERGKFIGEKAGGRAKQSAANLVISTVCLAGTFFLGAVSSSYSAASPLMQKVGYFLVETESSISSLVADLPSDIRYAIAEFLKELPNDPLVIPDSKTEMKETSSRRRSRLK